MTSSPAITHSSRELWLARRRSLITASDCGAILGADSRRSAYAVWAEKVGGLEVEDNLAMSRGRRYEKVIGEDYAEQTGRPVLPKSDPYEIAIHPDLPWLGATVDTWTERLVGDEADPQRGPLQIKMAIGSARDWRDGAPTAYQVQVAIETACAGTSWGALCALVGPGPLRVFDLERDDAFLRLAIPKLEEFHWMVVNRVAPEADGKDSTSAALKALYKIDDGATVDLGEEGRALLDAWDNHEMLAEAEQEQSDAAKNQIRALMGAATFAWVPAAGMSPRTLLSLKTTKKGHRVFRRERS